MAARKLSSAKRIQEKKKKRVQKLRRKAEPGYFGSASFVIQPPGQEKMSQVLERFVQPYRRDTDTRGDFRKLLGMGVIAWNAALLPKESRLAELEKAAAQCGWSTSGRQQFLAVISEMIDRKDRYFSTNKRAIVDFEVRETPEGINLFVISMPQGSLRS